MEKIRDKVRGVNTTTTKTSIKKSQATIRQMEEWRNKRGKILNPPPNLLEVIAQMDNKMKFTNLMEAYTKAKGNALKLDKLYTFRTNDQEMETMRQRAAKYDLSVADYLRLAMFVLDGE
jgi:uncharacterized membrane protein YgaE (UPF0421/DUF939 family)